MLRTILPSNTLIMTSNPEDMTSGAFQVLIGMYYAFELVFRSKKPSIAAFICILLSKNGPSGALKIRAGTAIQDLNYPIMTSYHILNSPAGLSNLTFIGP